MLQRFRSNLYNTFSVGSMRADLPSYASDESHPKRFRHRARAQ